MPSQTGSRAWHIEQLPSTTSKASPNPSAEANCCSRGVNVRASASSRLSSIGATESQAMMTKRMAVAAQVQCGPDPVACIVLK